MIWLAVRMSLPRMSERFLKQTKTKHRYVQWIVPLLIHVFQSPDVWWLLVQTETVPTCRLQLLHRCRGLLGECRGAGGGAGLVVHVVRAATMPSAVWLQHEGRVGEKDWSHDAGAFCWPDARSPRSPWPQPTRYPRASGQVPQLLFSLPSN